MGNNKRYSLEEAIALINDGDMVTFSGFTVWRRPMAAVYEMIRQKKKDLHIVEVNSGTHTELLIGAGCVKIWESCWIGHELFGKVPHCMNRELKKGTIIAEDYSHQHMVYRLAAGAYGVPYLPTYAAKGSDILNPDYDMLGNNNLRTGEDPHIPKKKFDFQEDPFYDEGTLIHVPAARPDVCVVSAQLVGEEGTLRILGQTYTDEEAIKAAKKVIVIAEEVVPETYLREDPAANLIPSYLVDAIVELPWNAHPTGSYGAYDIDGAFISKLAEATRTEEGTREWLNEWVYGISSHDEYLDKLGASYLDKFKANSYMKYSTRLKRGV